MDMDNDCSPWPIIDCKDLLDLEKDAEENDVQNGVGDLSLVRLPSSDNKSKSLSDKICKKSVIKLTNDIATKDSNKKYVKRVSFSQDKDQNSNKILKFHGKCHLASGSYFKDWISATHILSGSRISIKIVHKDGVHGKGSDLDQDKKGLLNNRDANDWKRVMNERKIWQSLSHLKHVVPLISFISSDANYYFITPSIDTLISLDAILFEHKPIPLMASMIISGQLASVIDKIHSFGIMIRNLSSASVLIDNLGVLRLVDFKDAKEITISRRIIDCDDDYKSPEMLKCKNYTDATDWWAFGIILLQLLSGSTPLAIYKEKTSISSEMDNLDVLLRATDLIPEMISKVPKSAQNLLQNLLQTNPKKRLGFDPNDFVLIQKDEFYKGLSWKKLAS